MGRAARGNGLRDGERRISSAYRIKRGPRAGAAKPNLPVVCLSRDTRRVQLYTYTPRRATPRGERCVAHLTKCRLTF